MCGILGIIGTYNSNKTIKALKKIEHRGKDAFGVFYRENDKNNLKHFIKKEEIVQFLTKINPNIALIHNLLSINNYVPQPLYKNNLVFLYNGEIYNWKTLKKKYNLEGKNDTEVFLNLIIKKGIENIKSILKEIDGDYAVACIDLKTERIYLFRDRLGIKPLFYKLTSDGFYIASENKTFKEMTEINPREIVIYNIPNRKIEKVKRDFFKPGEELKEVDLNILEKYLQEAILKRVPQNQKLLLLFSGGIDSSLIALILKKNNINFTAITAGTKNSKDLEFSKYVAKRYNINHKTITIDEEKIRRYIKEVIETIETHNYVKVSVALPFYLALKEVKGEGRVVFSGLGSEELYAGYKRFEHADDITQECIKGLLSLHERDLYRDDLVAMKNGFELRLPFLDNTLIKYSLKIPPILKIKENKKKIILEKLALKMGFEKVAKRKKIAAQYGSGVDKILNKIAKKNRITKSEVIKILSK